MDATTITSSSFTLTGPNGAVAATVAYDGATSTATLTPSAALANSTSYTAKLDTTVKSADGVSLASAVTWTFTTVASTPAPVVSITSSPANPTNQTSATIDFGADQSSTIFTCQLDGGTATTCTSPAAYTGLAAGSHTFTVTGTTAGGSNSASVTWRIDTTPPTITLSGQPTNPTTQTSATFSFTSDKSGSTFACQLDGPAPATCTSPVSYSALADGSHTFTVTATDPAGNTASATYTWKVDTTAPVSTISYPVAGTMYAASGANTWAGGTCPGVCGTTTDATSGVAKVEVAIKNSAGSYWNGTAFSGTTAVWLLATGTTSWTYSFAGTSFPTDGSYTAMARGTDAAGNVEGTATTAFSFNVAPTVTFASANTQSINEGSSSTTQYTYNFTVSEASTGDTFTASSPSCGSVGTLVSGSLTYSAGSGSFKCTFATSNVGATSTVAVTATDAGGLATTGQQSVKIANLPPTVTITSPLAGATYLHGSSNVIVNASWTDPGNDGPYTCVINWGDGKSNTITTTSTSCSTNHVYAAASKPTITVTVTDSHGGSGSATRTINII
jgi:hypothetical protein